MAAAETDYHTPYGTYRLQRYPARREEPLQAWCGADTLLLDEIHRLGPSPGDVLTVNDEHGALSIPLRSRALWTDSALAALALERNLAANQGGAVPVIWSTSNPPSDIALVALRVPKQLPYFEYQLALLGSLLPAGTPVLAAGMDKHLSPRTVGLLEQYIGPAERPAGRRKAHLFSARLEQRASTAKAELAAYFCEALGTELVALPNVFSRDKLDGGSRLLLEHMDKLAPAKRIVDLACGNGVLGLAGLRLGIGTDLVCCDESAMAVESARRNSESLFPGAGARISFHHGDGLLHYTGPPADLILCNPPFHLNHAVDEYAGRRLLAQCVKHLEPGGRLCLVANRHLAYRPTLKRHFQRVERLAEDARFVVWLATRG